MRKIVRMSGMLTNIDFISRDINSVTGKAWSAYCPIKTESGEYINNKGLYIGEVVLGKLKIAPGEVVMVTSF